MDLLDGIQLYVNTKGFIFNYCIQLHSQSSHLFQFVVIQVMETYELKDDFFCVYLHASPFIKMSLLVNSDKDF